MQGSLERSYDSLGGRIDSSMYGVGGHTIDGHHTDSSHQKYSSRLMNNQANPYTQSFNHSISLVSGGQNTSVDERNES